MFEGQGERAIQAFLANSKPKESKNKRRRIGEKGSSESESYEPDFHQIKKHGLQLKDNRVSSGSWSFEQSKIYLKFMEDNRSDFQTQKQRRRTKVFYRLSKVLRKRTPDQCRSHHQKLQIKCLDNLDTIMRTVLEKIQQEEPDCNEAWKRGSKDIGSKKTGLTSDANDEDSVTIFPIIVDLNELAVW